MPQAIRDEIQREVVNYLRARNTPERLRTIAEDLRNQKQEFKDVSDSDFRSVVQPMIVTGKLSYAPGLKIKLGQ